MPDFESMKRNATLRIKLQDRIHVELTEYADLYGLPTSTLAAQVLGEWLNRQNMQKKAISDLVTNLVSDEVISKMESALGPTISAAISAAMNEGGGDNGNAVNDRDVDERLGDSGKKGRKDGRD